jgi:hypothetical protein
MEVVVVEARPMLLLQPRARLPSGLARLQAQAQRHLLCL